MSKMISCLLELGKIPACPAGVGEALQVVTQYIAGLGSHNFAMTDPYQPTDMDVSEDVSILGG